MLDDILYPNELSVDDLIDGRCYMIIYQNVSDFIHYGRLCQREGNKLRDLESRGLWCDIDDPIWNNLETKFREVDNV